MNAELKNCRVLVTTTSFGKSDPDLRRRLEAAVGEVLYNPVGRPLSATELASAIKGVDGLIAGVDSIDSSVVEAADRLKVIARYGTGIDRVDVRAATRKGIVVTNTPGANSVAVAELTICLLLALARRVCEANAATHSGQWPRFTGLTLRGKTVGVVGLGAIGREVAERLRPFGCRLLGTDPVVDEDTARRLGVTRVSLDELLAQSDAVTLHVPATDATQGMINRKTLADMKPGALLVNTARGELIDEAALRDSIAGGHLGGVALDVFRQEPPGADHPLLGFERVILTPHMASRADDAMNQMGRLALEDCLAVLCGDRPRHPVNSELY